MSSKSRLQRPIESSDPSSIGHQGSTRTTESEGIPSEQHSYDIPGDFYPGMMDDDLNHSPDGTFGRHTNRTDVNGTNRSIHSKSNENIQNLPSPILLSSSAERRSLDNATPTPTAILSSISKGKQKAKDDYQFTRNSFESSIKSSIRWSGELPRLDEDEQQQQKENYRTPLSPRLQAILTPPIAIQKTSNQSLDRIPSDVALDLTSDLGGSNRGTNYRRYERELESRQRSREGGVERFDSLSPVSSDRSPTPTSKQPLDSTGRVVDTAPSAKRGKRVSLGQVSVDGVPFTIGSPIYTNNSSSQSGISPSRHLRTDSRNSAKLSAIRKSSNTSNTAATQAGRQNARRLALSDSSKSAQAARKLRKRTSSDPIVKNDLNQSDLAIERRSEDSRGGMFGMFEGGRARRLTGPSTMDGNLAISQITLAPSTIHSQTKSEQNLTVDRSEASPGLLEGIPPRNSSQIMRWDPAHSTALSLRQLDPYGYASGEGYNGNRISTNSTILMQNRTMARYHLGILSSLRSRIPRHPSESLKSIQFRSIYTRIHHTFFILQSYSHVLATIFFDYNALYTLIQIALYPDSRDDDQSTAWWIAIGIYAGCFIIWFVVILIVWEFLIQYKRRWINDRPFALPIYLSSSGFNLSCIKSFSIYSLFYKSRFQAKKKDFIIESFWFLSQNWPTVLTILPRGIILTILLVIYHPSSSSNGPIQNRLPVNLGQMRDPVYFSANDGLLTSFSYIILLVYVIWIAWRTMILIVSWIGLFFTLGPKFLSKRERSMYEDEEQDISMTDFRLSTSSRPLLRHHDSAVRQESEQLRLNKRTNTEMQQISNAPKPTVERQSINTTRPDINSVEIPRRSHSLIVQDPSRSKEAFVQSNTGRQANESEIFPNRKVELPNWAWRARAEERLNSLLLECQIVNGENLTSDEMDESTEFYTNGRNSSSQQHRRRQTLQDDLPPTTMTQESITNNPITVVSPAIDIQDWTDRIGNHESEIESSPEVPIQGNNFLNEMQIARDKNHLQSVSTIDVDESSDVFPFPRKSEEMILHATNVLSHSSLVHPPITTAATTGGADLTTKTTVHPTISPIEQIQEEEKQEQLFQSGRNGTTNPYNTTSNIKRSSKRSLTPRKQSSSNSGSNSTSSLVESIRTALAGGNRSSAEISRTQQQQQPKGKSQEFIVTPTTNATEKEVPVTNNWWKGLFSVGGGVVTDENKSNDQIIATGNSEPYPRSSSPLSGMRTSTLHRIASEEDNSGELNRKQVIESPSVANPQKSNAIAGSSIEQDSESIHSTSTDDSEERRIWSQFPEQSRRHPPGLIALELEQRSLAEKRLREQMGGINENDINTTMKNPVSSTSEGTQSGTKATAIANDNSDSANASFEGDSSFGSTIHLLPSSQQLEILGPIQEESWSNSHETTETDEEIEFMQSEQQFTLRR